MSGKAHSLRREATATGTTRHPRALPSQGRTAAASPSEADDTHPTTDLRIGT